MLTSPAPSIRTKTSSNAATLKLVRKVHLYFGLFIAPALLFFAFTGAVQTLSLHEAAGSSYQPPAFLAELGQLHKKQTPRMPVRKAPASAKPDKPRFVSAASQPEPTLRAKQAQHLPMKMFFLLVTLGLFTSTLTGIYMAYKYERNRALVTGMIAGGFIVPLLLLAF